MYTLNAFVSIPELANNVPGKVAKAGELSPKARTYSREKRNFIDKNNYPGIELVTFAILDETSTTVQSPDDKVINKALAVSYFLYTQYSKSAIPLKKSVKTLENGVATEFSDIRNVQINSIIDTETTGKRLVDRITFDYLVNTTEEWKITLYFSDEEFRKHYPLYEIVVIPPVGDIHRLLQSPADTLDAVNSVTIEYFINRTNAITSIDPDTALQTYTTRWHDPAGSDTTMDIRWTLVIYGGAGNDLDAIKDAIREYIATNSTSQEWPTVFPDLYSENEFLVMPLWGMLSTDTNGFDDGLYSSIATLKELDYQSNRLLPNSYKAGKNANEFKEENLGIWASSYRAMQIMTIGNPNNKKSISDMRREFPDYMAVSTDKPDFSRMSLKTQDFVLKLLEALEVARSYTLNVSLPVHYTKAVKGNREYIGFEYEGYTYYVLTRMGYLKDL